MLKGYPQYAALANMIFPWIDEYREDLNTEAKATAKGFLDILVNTMWFILQNCTLLVGKYKRAHFMFDTFPEIFRSEFSKTLQEN